MNNSTTGTIKPIKIGIRHKKNAITERVLFRFVTINGVNRSAKLLNLILSRDFFSR